MKQKLTVFSVFAIVTVVALVGMLLGAGFGCASGYIAPSLFEHIFPWEDLEPIGVATVLGAFGGVICGGALGVFALVLKAFSESSKTERDKDA